MYRSMPFLVNNRTCTFSLLRTWRASGCKEHPCPWLLEATGISCGYRQPLCGMPGARTDPSDPSVLRSASDG